MVNIVIKSLFNQIRRTSKIKLLFLLLFYSIVFLPSIFDHSMARSKPGINDIGYIFLLIYIFLLSLTMLVVNHKGLVKFNKNHLVLINTIPNTGLSIFIYGFLNKNKNVVLLLLWSSVLAILFLPNYVIINLNILIGLNLILLISILFSIIITISVNINFKNGKVIIYSVSLFLILVFMSLLLIYIFKTPLFMTLNTKLVQIWGGSGLLARDILKIVPFIFITICSGYKISSDKLFKYCKYPLELNNKKSRDKTVITRQSEFSLSRNTIFNKQLKENFRRNKIFFDYGTVIIFILFVVMGIGMSQTKTTEGEFLNPDYIIYIGSFILSIFSTFMFGVDTIKEEISKGYINLFPMNPLYKILSLSILPLVKISILAFVIIPVTAFLIKADMLLSIFCVLLYCSQTFLFISTELSYLKFTGLKNIDNKILNPFKFIFSGIFIFPQFILMILAILSKQFLIAITVSILINLGIYFMISYKCRDLVN